MYLIRSSMPLASCTNFCSVLPFRSLQYFSAACLAQDLQARPAGSKVLQLTGAFPAAIRPG